ncbi:MAG: hypothetical protein SO471_14270 [Anaerobutyricum hallii]|uniref:DUF6985 domain-containing protein n=1 Tax=Anaerobutyricum hallii TaxID=39488 RepID=UPI002A82DA7B|nr:hypothetical protein [Anaerobutyricum hallii]MDY4579081.1 hypothetical protein [Anaerobutyricum hallii]
MNKVRVTVWGRPFNLSVIYDCYENESIQRGQSEALENFIRESDVLITALEPIKKYCLDDERCNEVSKIDNIFKFVIPTAIFVKRIKKDAEIVLLCDYKFDLEHGLAIIFKNNRFVGITEQGAL